MTVERMVTIDAADPSPGRVNHARLGPAGRRERKHMARSPRPRPPKADLAEELIASMEEAVRIIAGEVPPSRVHTATELAARATGKRQRAPDAPGRDDRA